MKAKKRNKDQGGGSKEKGRDRLETGGWAIPSFTAEIRALQVERVAIPSSALVGGCRGAPGLIHIGGIYPHQINEAAVGGGGGGLGTVLAFLSYVDKPAIHINIETHAHNYIRDYIQTRLLFRLTNVPTYCLKSCFLIITGILFGSTT